MTTPLPVAEGALVIESRDEDAPLLARWLPRAHPRPIDPKVSIALRPLGPDDSAWVAEFSHGQATLSLATVRAWVEPGSRRVALVGRVGTGILDLAGGSAVIDPGGALDDGYTMLTISAGLLLASVGRVLVHAGAVCRPDGGVLLLAGDTHSGKSSTTLTLARAPRWAWLSDDQVVLAARPDDAVDVFGWVRTPHLDEGYASGLITGRRREADAEFIATLSWVASGRLAGLVLPIIRADAPSGTRPAAAIDAMEALIRQGAWIMSERESARMALRVLRIAAAAPARRLDLGRDTFSAPERLAALLRD